MKYLSVDLETTGLNPETCQIIEFAAVLDDLENPKPIKELPTFQTYILPPNLEATYTGEPYALSMHSALFKRIAKREKGFSYLGIGELMRELRKFLIENQLLPQNWDLPAASSESRVIKITAAGKNFAAFDLSFLKKHIPEWSGVQFNHRFIDPAMFFLKPNDEAVPDSATCLQRAGLEGVVAHTALEDALMVVKLVRKGLKIQDSH